MNNNKTIQFSFLVMVLTSLFPHFVMGGNTDKGMEVFKMCDFCHMLGEGAKNHIGPDLNNIIGSNVAEQKDFNYSEAFINAAKRGLKWDVATMDSFLENPQKIIPNNKMSFLGIKDPKDRVAVISFLTEFSGEKVNQKPSVGFTIPNTVLTLEGDSEYGEYLSSECTTCHQASGKNKGIPNIVGWEINNFVIAMHAYKAKHRENPVMQMIAGRLSDEEIAALAEYFNNLK